MLTPLCVICYILEAHWHTMWVLFPSEIQRAYSHVLFEHFNAGYVENFVCFVFGRKGYKYISPGKSQFS